MRHHTELRRAAIHVAPGGARSIACPMALTGRAGPRVSRETRRLLATVLLSLAALWVLARIRFPEQPPTPDPVAPLLRQLSPRTTFEDLERAVLELEPEVLPALLVISAEATLPAGNGSLRRQAVASLRFRDDAAVALIEAEAGAPTGVTLLARDPASGLAVVQTASSAAPALRTWTPRRMEYPRYVMVSEASHGRVALRPVFVGSLRATSSSTWLAEVWTLPFRADVQNGAFVFTTAGALLGLVAGQPEDPVIVPASAVLSAAERLLTADREPAGWLGVEVQALTAAIRAATGQTAGVAVTWVDSQGAVAGKLAPTDVIRAIGEHPIMTLADWHAHVSRLPAGGIVVLHVQRGGRTEDVPVTPLPPRVAARSPKLGLTMLVRPRIGAEVVHVQDGSVASRAGIAAGDVLTRVGAVAAPTPAQVNRAFAASSDGAVFVAITRGAEHIVTVLVKP